MTAPAEREFPADSVLIARGKMSTLNSEKRAHLKALRDDCEALSDAARLILRGAQEPNDRTTFAQEEMQIAEERLRAAKIRLAALAVLEPQLAELKPKAWPKHKEEVE